MGNPQHFSLVLPQRCQQLLRALYSDLPHGENCGPVPRKLSATFLLAISMPMINLPLERINKYRNDRKAKHAQAEHMNDSPLSPRLAKAIRLAIDEKVDLKDAPFFSTRAWSYQKLPKGTGFPNLAQNGLPDDVAQRLGDKASEAGPLISTKLFCEILRNSLAHGGILFLNQDGKSSDNNDPVLMFAFVSTDKPYNPTALHFLRIGMKDYRTFLGKWAKWLKNSGLQEDLEANVEGNVAAAAYSTLDA